MKRAQTRALLVVPVGRIEHVGLGGTERADVHDGPPDWRAASKPCCRKSSIAASRMRARVSSLFTRLVATGMAV